jgi:hypothetical protein
MPWRMTAAFVRAAVLLNDISLKIRVVIAWNLTPTQPENLHCIATTDREGPIVRVIATHGEQKRSKRDREREKRDR